MSPHEKRIFLKIRKFFPFGLSTSIITRASLLAWLNLHINVMGNVMNGTGTCIRVDYSSRISIPAERNRSRRFHLKLI